MEQKTKYKIEAIDSHKILGFIAADSSDDALNRILTTLDTTYNPIGHTIVVSWGESKQEYFL